MKNFVTIIFVALCTFANAQITVNTSDLNDPNIKYIEVWEKYDKTSDKYVGMADYGQDDDLEDREGTSLRITDVVGEPKYFNGAMHILNYMYSNGWELVHIKSMVNHESYLMKRRSDYKLAVVKMGTN